MGILKKIKLWWKTTPTKDKILYAVSGVSVAASVASIATCVYMKNSVENVHVDVKLYPGGKDDPNPVDLTPDSEERPVVQTSPNDYITCVPSPADDGRYDPYELARDAFNSITESAVVYDEDGRMLDDLRLYAVKVDALDKAQELCLQLAWDLAARENKLEQAEDEIPLQVHD